MANITVLKPDEAKIATLHMLGESAEKIASELVVATTYVVATLKSKHVRDFIQEIETQDAMAVWLHKKVRFAKGELLDGVIDGCQKILKNIPAEKWNKNHVDMFKFMLQDIKVAETKIVQNIMNQVNIQVNEQKSSDMEELDEMIAALPASVQNKFWENVILLAKKTTDEFNKRLIVGQ